MRNYIILNGNNSNEITGLLIQSLPPISKPLMRTAIEEIDGRDGDIVTTLGYSAYDKEVSIGLYGDYDVDEVIKYFNDNSKGQVTFSNEPDKYYNYEIINQIDFERLIRFKTATVTLHCQPFKYPTEETPVEIAYQYVNNEAEEMDLDNTADAPMTMDLKGNTQQDSTTGKNKFSTDFKTNDTLTTYTKIDSNSYSFTCSGTWKSAIFVVPCKENTDYFFNYDDTSNGTYCYIKGTQTQTDLMGRYHGYFLTFNSGANTTLTITISNGNSSGITSGTLSNIQLEEGTTTTSFEKYSGGSPSPSPLYPQEIHNVSGDNEVKVVGKNLFGNTYNNLGMYKTGAGEIGTFASGSNYLGAYCKVEEGETYSVSRNILTSRFAVGFTKEIPNINTNCLAFFRADSAYKMENITIPSGYSYLVLYLSNSSETSTNLNIQIEKSSTSSEYELYQSQTYPIYLGVENLINYNDFTTYGTTTITDETISIVNNTASIVSGISLVLTGILKAGKYTFTSYSASNDGLFVMQSSSDYSHSVLGGNSYTFDYDGTSYLRILGTNMNAGDTKIYQMQLEKGSVSHPYTPYGVAPIELCKIGDYQDEILKSTGKNIYNPTIATLKQIGNFATSNILTATANSSVTIDNSNYLNGTANAYVVLYIPFSFESGKTIYNNGYIGSRSFIVYDENGNVVQIGFSELSYTPSSNFNGYLGIGINSGDNVNNKVVMFSYENNPTLEPYGTGWYIHKEIGKVVLDGSEDWSTASNGVLYTTSIVGYATSNNIPYSNYFVGKNNVATATIFYNYGDLTIGFNNSTSRLFIRYDSITSGSDFKTWLSTHNIICYYVLATPTNTIITDTNLINQLNNLANSRSYDTRTHITQNANDKPFMLNATAMKKGTDTGIVDNDGNIYSKPTLDIEGTGTVGIYLNGNQMFSVDMSSSSECIIDVTNLEAYDPSTNQLMNRQVTGDYSNFTLPVGENEVKVSGNVIKATISNYVRWL